MSTLLIGNGKLSVPCESLLNISMLKNLYCYDKFNQILIDVENRFLYNCCHAYPERLNIDECEKDPTKIILSDQMVKDRKLMLENKRFKSCEICYGAEDRGEVSYRDMVEPSKHLDNPNLIPKTIAISISTDCNMACAYCSPRLSSTWRHTVAKHGPVGINELTSMNKVQIKLKQHQRSQSKFFKLLIIAIENNIDSINKIVISGGEPLIHKEFFNFVEKFSKKVNIQVVTGLGTPNTIFQKFLELASRLDINVAVSAESVGTDHEFIRYDKGMPWERFHDRLKKLDEYNINYEFFNTHSNLSTFKYKEFLNLFGHKKLSLNFVTDPYYLKPCILDPESKEKFVKEHSNNPAQKKFIDLVLLECTEQDRIGCANYLKRLSTIRNISLQTFPSSFLNWLNIN
jgi:organic radical activating enzyme